MKTVRIIIVLLLSIVVIFQCDRKKVVVERYVDTVVVRDTIRDTLRVPRLVYLTRTDTVLLKAAADTVYREVLVPIERKEFVTPDYHAVIEGYKPELLRMEVFPETKYITDTRTLTLKSKPRFGLGIQAGYGYNRTGLSPYIGVGIQYNIVTF